jgi:hypothetical protein
MTSTEILDRAGRLSARNKEAWKQIICSFVGWQIEQGLCPAELQCCFCRQMKLKSEIVAIYFTDPLAEPLCADCLVNGDLICEPEVGTN